LSAEDGDLVYGDLNATAWLAGLWGPGWTGFMEGVSRLGSRGAILAAMAVLALVLLLRRRWRDVAFLLLAYGGGEMTVSLVKAACQRPRPPAPLVMVHGYSFPSGHALNIVLICGFIIYLLWPVCRRAGARGLLLAVALGLILLVGYSRIYLRAHWLDDVLAGYAIALAWLFISKAVTGGIFPRPKTG
jgi:membrane-associated phospholipid phosphatase